MRYGSVCSGIESASIAWEPLGMRPAWFSEIEKFPSAVLAHHWPEVMNLGDMTQLAAMIRAGLIEAPEVLVGGTPCQAFSVAGLRKGLDDDRGQLTLTYVDILNAIDEQRGDGDEAVCVWENVPGVLSSRDNAFGCFLAALVGEDCELKPTGKKWSNAGCVFGPQRAVAWRVIDAQYFGVAQRRRRVFVVASARNGFDPAAVLFEREGLRRDIAPSREAPPPVATLTANGVGTCGADDNQAQAGHLIRGHRMAAFGEYADDETASCMKARDYKDATDLVTCFHPTQDPISARDISHTIGAGSSAQSAVAIGGNVAHTLRGEGFDASEDGTGRGTPIVSADALVRRLTPTECARLQGFPDNHARVPWRGKAAEDCPDGPQYKAYGNSKAVPCIRFIGVQLLQEWFK